MVRSKQLKKGPSGDFYTEVGKLLNLPTAQLMWAKVYGVHPLGVSIIEGRGHLNVAGASERLSQALKETGFYIKKVSYEVLNDPDGIGSDKPVLDLAGYKCTLILVKDNQEIEVSDEGWATYADSTVSRNAGTRNEPQHSSAILRMHAKTRARVRAYKAACEVLGYPIQGVIAEELGALEAKAEIVGEPESDMDAFAKSSEKIKNEIIMELQKIDNVVHLSRKMNKHMKEWKRQLLPEHWELVEQAFKERIAEIRKSLGHKLLPEKTEDIPEPEGVAQ